jgi:hypothetical protein
MKREFRVVIMTMVLLAAPWLSQTTGARAAVTGDCDILQSDNSFVARDASIASGTPWVVWATAQIGYKVELLCAPAFLIAPHQSGSGAWVAIEGPCCDGLLGNNNIIQDGYWVCQHSDGCDFSGFPWNTTGYFYAFGNAGDIFHLPTPHYIATATSGYHTFKVYLHYPGDGTRQWEFSVDGTIRKIIDDSWRTWNRQKVQTANELWNEGDQLGGTSGSVQNIRAISWNNGTTHTGLSGNPYRAGHCYPWSDWSITSSAWYSTWTNNTHADC